jgi:hypothetical protein
MTHPDPQQQHPTYPPPAYPPQVNYPPVGYPPIPDGVIPAQRQSPGPGARNGFGITALVLAIVGVVFGLVPLTGFIALICGSIGIVFGFLGIARASRGVATNRGMSITGTVLSALALVLGIWGMTITLQAAEKLGKDLGALSSTSQPRLATPEVSAPTPVPGQIAGDGTYVVGTDIQPGSYRTTGPAQRVIPNCYWTRNSDTSGELSSIIASDITQGPTTVTIKPTDGAFHTSGCQPWTKVN